MIDRSSIFFLSGKYSNGPSPPSLSPTLSLSLSLVEKHCKLQRPLSIVVVGASGDLAKKKTYPSLLHLFSEQLLPKHCVIWGYARSRKTNQEFRNHLKPYLMKTFQKTTDGDDLEQETSVDGFLSMCFYHSGSSYGDEVAYKSLIDQIETFENERYGQIAKNSVGIDVAGTSNRLFYLAVPPTVFAESGAVIRRVGMTKPATVPDGSDLDNNSTSGWTRVVIEKPFGHDLDSCNDLLGKLSSQFDESHLYRIDHYTAKEVVQNLMIFRFGNPLWEPIWNSKYIQSVTISFKEVRKSGDVLISKNLCHCSFCSQSHPPFLDTLSAFRD